LIQRIKTTQVETVKENMSKTSAGAGLSPSTDNYLSKVADRSPYKGREFGLSADLSSTRVFSKENAVLDGIQIYLDYSIGGRGFVFEANRFNATFNRFYAATVGRINIETLYPAQLINLFEKFKERDTNAVKEWISDFMLEQSLLPEKFIQFVWSALGDHMKPPKEFYMSIKFAHKLLEAFVKAEYPKVDEFPTMFMKWYYTMKEAVKEPVKPIVKEQKIEEEVIQVKEHEPAAIQAKQEEDALRDVVDFITERCEPCVLNDLASAVHRVDTNDVCEAIIIIRKHDKVSQTAEQDLNESGSDSNPKVYFTTYAESESHNEWEHGVKGKRGTYMFTTRHPRVQDEAIEPKNRLVPGPPKVKAPDPETDWDEYEEFFPGWHSASTVRSKPSDVMMVLTHRIEFDSCK